MSNPLFDRKPILPDVNPDHPFPATQQAKVDTLLKFGVDVRGRPDWFEQQAQREIADRFDVEAEIKKAEAAIRMSQKIHDPENAHLFTAEAAREAFKNTNEWIYVPSDWKQPVCPFDINDETIIEVRYRNNLCDIGKVYKFNQICWVQEGDEYDIVKFQIVHGLKF